MAGFTDHPIVATARVCINTAKSGNPMLTSLKYERLVGMDMKAAQDRCHFVSPARVAIASLPRMPSVRRPTTGGGPRMGPASSERRRPQIRRWRRSVGCRRPPGASPRLWVTHRPAGAKVLKLVRGRLADAACSVMLEFSSQPFLLPVVD